MIGYFRVLSFFILLIMFSVEAGQSKCEGKAFVETSGSTLNQLKSIIYISFLGLTESHFKKAKMLIEELEIEEIRALSDRDIQALDSKYLIEVISLRQLMAFTLEQMSQNRVLFSALKKALEALDPMDILDLIDGANPLEGLRVPEEYVDLFKAVLFNKYADSGN